MAKKFEWSEESEKRRREKIAEFRKLKGDAVRLKLLLVINEGGGMLTNRELGERANMSSSTVKRHLGIMYREGKISYQYVGGVFDPASNRPFVTREILLVKDPKQNAIPESEERSEGDGEEGTGATEAGPGDPEDV